ncbi:sensor domain-containing diguanylate cyclase [Picosynechococcus sp. NKBG15041c]|uniref:sensor domain-containing diguanylate cyclase n=1 Tax=Picosynechococcus sp. NKBG15041c TaxID=1407650 RepID=UPI00041D5FC9|nr:sensor domain-containing diguanylate cyclase [Picosynechococcus sp. NKBG15041c]
MANKVPNLKGQLPMTAGGVAWLLDGYAQAIALLEKQAAAIATLEADKEQIARQYREALQQYHQVKEQYDQQYSQQYQEYFSLPIPCYRWQAVEEELHLLDFNPAAARFNSQALQQPSLSLGQQPRKVFSALPTLYYHLNNCLKGSISTSQRLQFPRLNLYLRAEYVFIAPNQVLMFILDESEQFLTEQQLRQQVRQQSAIAKLGGISLNNSDFPKLLRQAAIFVARTLEVPYSCIYAKQEKTPLCILAAGFGWPADLIGAVTVHTGPNSHVGYTLEQKSSVSITDLRLETRFRGETLLHNYHVVSGVSIIIGPPDQPWGVLAVYSTEERDFSGDELYFLQAIANVLSSSIERESQAAEMNLLHHSINAIRQGVVITDAQAEDNPVIYVNRGFETITGYSATEIIGRNCNFLQGNDRQQPPLTQLRAAILKGQDCSVTLRNYRKTGEPFWNALHVFPVRDQGGYLTHFIGIQTDVSQEKAAAANLQKTEEQFRQVFYLAPIGMAITNLDGRYEQVNQAWCNIIGYEQDALLQKTCEDLTHPDDLPEEQRLNAALRQGDRQEFHREKRYIAQDGHEVHALVQVALVRDAEGNPLHVIRQMVDISDRKQIEQRLVQEAFYDHLTGLPNRTLLEERLEQVLKQQHRYPHHRNALLFLDLDYFKAINDRLGHLVGDQLLREFAKRICPCFRETDTLARLGGDEFVVLLKDIAETQSAFQVAQRIHKALETPIKLGEEDIYVQVSIGIVADLKTYLSATEILRDADLAMYRAKAKGRARSEIFELPQALES